MFHVDPLPVKLNSLQLQAWDLRRSSLWQRLAWRARSVARHEGSLHQSVWSCGDGGDEEVRVLDRLGEPACTKSAPNLVWQCGKLLIVNAGEVAERLKAAVC